MRKIKFRGWDKINEKWVYGYLVKSKYHRSQPILYSFIHTPHQKKYNKPSTIIMVDANSIGQYTGLKDKNGIEIYEGDIIQHFIFPNDNTYIVVFDDYSCAFMLENKYGRDMLSRAKNIEIIGNIHENKEMLKK